jgi:hypothetical protein
MSSTYRITTNGSMWRVEVFRPARFWRRAAWLPVQIYSDVFSFVSHEAQFPTQAEAEKCAQAMRDDDSAAQHGWQPVSAGAERKP